jgi:hypothetical protein
MGKFVSFCVFSVRKTGKLKQREELMYVGSSMKRKEGGRDSK